MAMTDENDAVETRFAGQRRRFEFRRAFPSADTLSSDAADKRRQPKNVSERRSLEQENVGIVQSAFSSGVFAS